MNKIQAISRVLACAALLALPVSLHAQESRPARATPVAAGNGGDSVRRAIALESGAGRVLTLSAPATNVFVADPKVAEVRPASATSLFVFGVGPGRTTVVAMDQAGRTIVDYDITVRASNFNSGEAAAAVSRLIPNSNIRVSPQARGLLLTGTVSSAADSARAVAVLRGFLPDGQTVENQLTVRDSIQVTLRVRIIEMNRNVTRALGVDWQSLGSIGRFAVSGLTTPGLGVAGAAVGALTVGTPDVNAVIRALAADNLARILAEPNLTVMSGQAASFLAGGEFPIPVSQKDNTITIEFKKYGVALAFVPTVMSDGRINLHVSPEVSQLTDTGSVRLSSSNSSLSIPALTVRRAETTVELGSGQSFAIAGLMNDSSTSTSSGIPFLGDLPVIGSLFRSTGFQRQETELVILVTPYIAQPVNERSALHTPDDNYTTASDLERILLVRQVGRTPQSAPARIPGSAGFIVQ